MIQRGKVVDAVMSIDCRFKDGCRITNGRILLEEDKGVCTSCESVLKEAHPTEGLQIGFGFKPMRGDPDTYEGYMFYPTKNDYLRGFYYATIKREGEGLRVKNYFSSGFRADSRHWASTSTDFVYLSQRDEVIFKHFPKVK